MWSGLVRAQAGWTAERLEQEWAKAMEGVMQVWAEALADFHRDVITSAVRDLAISELMWPPSLPEFVKMCREQEERIKPPTLVALTDDTAIADPESPKVKAAMAEMRNLLKRMPS